VLSDRGLCDGSIACPEEYYRVCYVLPNLISKPLQVRGPAPLEGCRATVMGRGGET